MKLIKLIAYNWSRYKQKDFLSVIKEDGQICVQEESRVLSDVPL